MQTVQIKGKIIGGQSYDKCIPSTTARRLFSSARVHKSNVFALAQLNFSVTSAEGTMCDVGW